MSEISGSYALKAETGLVGKQGVRGARLTLQIGMPQAPPPPRCAGCMPLGTSSTESLPYLLCVIGTRDKLLLSLILRVRSSSICLLQLCYMDAGIGRQLFLEVERQGHCPSLMRFLRMLQGS